MDLNTVLLMCLVFGPHGGPGLGFFVFLGIGLVWWFGDWKAVRELAIFGGIVAGGLALVAVAFLMHANPGGPYKPFDIRAELAREQARIAVPRVAPDFDRFEAELAREKARGR
jgi:hypothetical protein